MIAQTNEIIKKKSECSFNDYAKMGVELIDFFLNLIIYSVLALFVYIIINMYMIIMKYRKMFQEDLDGTIDKLVEWLIDFLFDLPKNMLSWLYDVFVAIFEGTFGEGGKLVVKIVNWFKDKASLVGDVGG